MTVAMPTSPRLNSPPTLSASPRRACGGMPVCVASMPACVAPAFSAAPGMVAARPAGVKANKPPSALGMSPALKPGGMAYSFWSTDERKMKLPLASCRTCRPGKLDCRICTVSCGLVSKVPSADLKDDMLIWLSSGIAVHSGSASVSGVERLAPVTISPMDSKNPIFGGSAGTIAAGAAAAGAGAAGAAIAGAGAGAGRAAIAGAGAGAGRVAAAAGAAA